MQSVALHNTILAKRKQNSTVHGCSPFLPLSVLGFSRWHANYDITNLWLIPDKVEENKMSLSGTRTNYKLNALLPAYSLSQHKS